MNDNKIQDAAQFLNCDFGAVQIDRNGHPYHDGPPEEFSHTLPEGRYRTILYTNTPYGIRYRRGCRGWIPMMQYAAGNRVDLDGDGILYGEHHTVVVYRRPRLRAA